MANKRVSMKGRGADLFFGDVSPGTDLTTPAPETSDERRNEGAASPAGSRDEVPHNSGAGRRARAKQTSSGSDAETPTAKSANQPSDQSINGLTSQLTSVPMGKPKGFYISPRLDARLDHAVRYFQSTHGLRKVDRSTLINAMLEDDSLWTDQSLDQLTDRLISQLTRRMTGR